MQESTRLRPVLPVVFRRAMKDVQIGPYLLPEGTILELHTLAMNTHPHYWERPDDFVPVRPCMPEHRTMVVEGCNSASTHAIVRADSARAELSSRSDGMGRMCIGGFSLRKTPTPYVHTGQCSRHAWDTHPMHPHRAAQHSSCVLG